MNRINHFGRPTDLLTVMLVGHVVGEKSLQFTGEGAHGTLERFICGEKRKSFWGKIGT